MLTRGMIALVLGLATDPLMAKSYVPAIGTSERAEIMDAIREGTKTQSIFAVDYLRVTSNSSQKIAFVQVHPADNRAAYFFEGWALLHRKPMSGWRVMWALASYGSSKCGDVRQAYTGAVRVAGLVGENMDFFSPAFRSSRMNVTPKDDYERCKGLIITNSDD